MIDPLEMGQDAACLPKLVVIGMVSELLPKEIVLAVIFAGVAQWTEIHVKLVAILGLWLDPRIPGLLSGTVMLVSEYGGRQEIAQQISAMVMEVIEEKI